MEVAPVKIFRYICSYRTFTAAYLLFEKPVDSYNFILFSKNCNCTVYPLYFFSALVIYRMNSIQEYLSHIMTQFQRTQSYYYQCTQRKQKFSYENKLIPPKGYHCHCKHYNDKYQQQRCDKIPIFSVFQVNSPTFFCKSDLHYYRKYHRASSGLVIYHL